MSEIKIGAGFEKTITVSEDMLAKNVGSGDVAVFATPMMMSLMEEVSAKCLLEFLDEGMTSVGTQISLSHLAATPVGMKVTAKAAITAVDGRKIDFKIEAHDEKDKIGEGEHSRFIVQRDKFEAKAQGKLL